MICPIETVINAYNAALIMKDGCVFKTVCTRYVNAISSLTLFTPRQSIILAYILIDMKYSHNVAPEFHKFAHDKS
jgi:hypothetical protein